MSEFAFETTGLTLDEAWAEAVAALPLQGWPAEDGRWVLPGSGYRIELRWISEGDGYQEPHEEGWLATARVDAYGAPAAVFDSGPLEPTPVAALNSLAHRPREPR